MLYDQEARAQNRVWLDRDDPLEFDVATGLRVVAGDGSAD
jgi:hypothetical protein